jgi:uncharacterized coiled-coil protein SlyX
MERSLIEARLATLKSEFSSGQRQLAEHENQVAALREQLLRISGAIRVLGELLAQPEESGVAQME